MTGFKKQMDTYIKPLEEALQALLPPQAGGLKCSGVSKLSEAMAYSLLSGGKRVRAVLLLATYETLGGDFHAAVPLAAAIEMVHAYSLVHDDLPCMDDDDMRRGKPSCHIKFGEATALLAGDGLLTLAFETLSLKENSDIFGAEKIVASIRTLSAAAGANGMVGGQILDIENENRDITLEDLELINTKKTGALIRSACEIGCILGGADEKTVESMLEYAEKIGLAFQLIDDILDVTADEGRLGKPIGSDCENRKTTYASLYGAEKAKSIAVKLTAEAVEALDRTGLDAKFLRGFAKALADRTY